MRTAEAQGSLVRIMVAVTQKTLETTIRRQASETMAQFGIFVLAAQAAYIKFGTCTELIIDIPHAPFSRPCQYIVTQVQAVKRQVWIKCRFDILRTSVVLIEVARNNKSQ